MQPETDYPGSTLADVHLWARQAKADYLHRDGPLGSHFDFHASHVPGGDAEVARELYQEFNEAIERLREANPDFPPPPGWQASPVAYLDRVLRWCKRASALEEEWSRPMKMKEIAKLIAEREARWRKVEPRLQHLGAKLRRLGGQRYQVRIDTIHDQRIADRFRNAHPTD